PMEKPGAEVIVGLIKDRTFGLSIMFGMGGILTELYHDVAFRLVPITKEDAQEMIDDIRASRIFYGFRRMKVSREAIVDLLVKISAFGDKYQADINQLDLNPVFVREDDAVVIDAKMILEPC
ncbi:MAG: acetate--CoA ligase family protein, partial [Methanomassiliicoccales archaeon]